MWKVIDYNGKIALTLGWHEGWDEPYYKRELVISNVPIERYPGIEGKRVKFRENIGIAWINNRPIKFDTNDEDTWTRTTETGSRIRKPRKTDRYDYEWEKGEWRVKYYN